MPGKKNQRHVIFASPERQGEPSSYIDYDGAVTDVPSRVAKFLTLVEAKSFADMKGIELTDVVYIGLQDFNDSELALNPGLEHS